MNEILDRIEAWQSAGLIDAETAARLRTAEMATEPAPVERHSPLPRVITGGLGPTPTIAEMFAYLGAAFFIAAYSTFLARFASDSRDRDVIMTVGSALGTIVLVAIGLMLARRDERARRGAGALFVVAVSGTAVTADFLTQVLGWSWGPGPQLFAAVVTVGVAIGLRAQLPAVMTQVGLLGSLTFLGTALLDLVRRALEGTLAGDGSGAYPGPGYVPPSADIGRDVLLPVVGWLLLALGLGLLGLREARAGTAASDARAGITRFWAGMVAILGTWSGVSATGYLGGDHWDRILEPWIGDAILISVVAVLVERALRRDAVAFILPGAIGLIAALTDLNFRYLSNSTEVGLLVEGAILLAVGYAADRIRRRLGGGPHTPVAPPPVPPVPPAEAAAVS